MPYDRAVTAWFVFLQVLAEEQVRRKCICDFRNLEIFNSVFIKISENISICLLSVRRATNCQPGFALGALAGFGVPYTSARQTTQRSRAQVRLVRFRR